ncbi:MAG: indole-3-glycerol-phosphate synthase [Methanomicrobiales archaeon]|nr:indole-3-glycerol-phosphate synthase [Methanomicrobiales archaeon]
MMLEDILAATQERVSALPSAVPRSFPEKTRSLSRAIRSVSGANPVIGELKFASPAGGLLQSPANAESLAADLVQGGCVALSVITEPTFFRGSTDLLIRVRKLVPVPVLRKDFIIDPGQVYESRAMGADAILLIARILGEDLLRYASLARFLGLEPLVEVHTPEEIRQAHASGAGIIGINNRDLQTMEVDLRTTERLAPLCGDRLRISMSGIRDPADIRRLKGSVDAFLIGSSLMTASDPRSAMEGFVSA